MGGTVPTTPRVFIIARNPDPDSRLPYLLRLPLADAPILKARDTWPRTARVFCHRADEWPEDAELIEEVPVLGCVRRGVAIDLVLDRPRENRSQFVFTTLPTGREGIFWQTRKVVGTARPGARIPTRRISDVGAITIVIDTRERYPYRFAKQQATTIRRALPAGDYGVFGTDGAPLAAVERKALADLAGSPSCRGRRSWSRTDIRPCFGSGMDRPASCPTCWRGSRCATRRSRSPFARRGPSPRSGPTGTLAPPWRSLRAATRNAHLVGTNSAVEPITRPNRRYLSSGERCAPDEAPFVV